MFQQSARLTTQPTSPQPPVSSPLPMPDEKLIQRIVAEVVRRLKALEGRAVSAPIDPPVSLVTEDLVKSAISRGGDAVYVTPNAIVTPLARDLIRQQKVRLVVAEAEVEIQDSQKSSVIAIGADHKGFELKKQIVLMLQDAGREVMDCGVHSPQEASYVGVAKAVADVVLEKNLLTGIVIDGGGTGAALVANKVKGIRAVSCHDVTSAKFARAPCGCQYFVSRCRRGGGYRGKGDCRDVVEYPV